MENSLRLNIQLFRQRLSHKSVKAYAAMSIGIMGSKMRFRVIQQQGTRKKEYASLCCFLPPDAETT